MRKLSAEWVPKCLNVNYTSPLSNFWNFSALSKWCPVAIGDHGQNVVISLWPGDKATMNGVAAYRITPPRSKKFRVQKFAGKILACLDFLGSRRHPPNWLSSKGPNYQRGVLSFLLVQLKDILKEKRQSRGKVTKGVLFLHDNALAHQALATQKKPAYLGFQCLDHPPYSLDLALSDYHLFPGLKKQLKGPHFLSDTEVIAAVETRLDRQPSEFFFEWLAKLRAIG